MKSRHRRQRQIAEVLVRHGLGYVVDAVGLERFRTSSRGGRDDSRTAPERLRRVLEDLGPTFIKLGQILSTRADLLGPEYQAELAKLQDAAPPLAPQEVWEVIVLELGGQEQTAFASFGLEPLADVDRAGSRRNAERRDRGRREGSSARHRGAGRGGPRDPA
jgi:ubiquinone biosynthesis protein